MSWHKLGRFQVPGEPQGKGRPRFVRSTGRAYTPGRTLHYEDRVATIAALVFEGQDLPLGPDVPVRLEVEALFTRPRRLYRRKDSAERIWAHRARVDGDNILKAIGDGLQRILFTDDRQVVLGSVSKRYTRILDRKEKRGELSEVLVTVWTWGEQ